jgi:NAD(P)-dependent dehydrogenase (short-subunit alcohol dehydrogenase family)
MTVFVVAARKRYAAPMQETRLAIVTGATGAIGGAIAKGIAAHGHYELLLLVRDANKGQRVVDAVQRATGNHQVAYAVVDLALKSSIWAFAGQFARPVHVLVNNAAIAPRTKQMTAEGHELMFATNVLGYFWLTQVLKQHLIGAAPARVVNVASYWARDLDLDDLEFARRRYDNNTAYRQSKQANRMLTVVLAEQLGPHNVTVNACHPGDVNSTLSNSLGFAGSESPEGGARTPVWLAVDPAVSGVTGKYFADCREASCSFAKDRRGIERLMQICSG